MTKVKTFLHIFLNSTLPLRSSYLKIARLSTSVSVKYFTLFVVILYFICLPIFFFNNIIRTDYFYLPERISQSVKSFPGDLIVSIKDGKMTSSYNHPYFMWITFNQEKQLLLVIDEYATPEKIREYDSFALLTSRELVFQNTKTNKISTFSLENKNITIDKQTITMYFEKFMQGFKVFEVVAIIFFVLVFPILVILLNLFYLFIASLIVLFIFHVFLHNPLSFKSIYKLSLHSITLPLILNYAIGLFINTSPKTLPPMFFMLVTTFLFMAVYEVCYDKS